MSRNGARLTRYFIFELLDVIHLIKNLYNFPKLQYNIIIKGKGLHIMKKNYWVIIKNGFVGCRRFITEDDANDACESMNMLDPGWIVQGIVCG